VQSGFAIDDFFLYFYRMKFFAFLMASLLLALSILPWAGEGITLKQGKVKAEITKQHDHQEQEHNDACSPFCHCTCCTGFSINHFFDEISSLAGIDSQFYTPYLPGNPIQYSPSIWQPPKLQV